jgi:hypothetical protein
MLQSKGKGSSMNMQKQTEVRIKAGAATEMPVLPSPRVPVPCWSLRISICLWLTFILVPSVIAASAASLIADPGVAHLSLEGDKFKLSNGAIEGTWEIAAGELKAVSMRDLLEQRYMPVPTRLFELEIANAAPVTSDSMAVVSGPVVQKVYGDQSASRLADRYDGQQVSIEMRSTVPAIDVSWRVILRDGSNYLRQELTLRARGKDIEISSVRLIDMFAPEAFIVGTVKGAPVVAGNSFFAFEHPIAESRINKTRRPVQYQP